MRGPFLLSCDRLVRAKWSNSSWCLLEALGTVSTYPPSQCCLQRFLPGFDFLWKHSVDFSAFFVTFIQVSDNSVSCNIGWCQTYSSTGRVAPGSGWRYPGLGFSSTTPVPAGPTLQLAAQGHVQKTWGSQQGWRSPSAGPHPRDAPLTQGRVIFLGPAFSELLPYWSQPVLVLGATLSWAGLGVCSYRTLPKS